MISDVLQALGATFWVPIGLIFFVVLFIGIIVWTMHGGRHRFDRERQLPLDHDDHPLSEPEQHQP
jgi:cbb3-type cytochrome oxidase subunit 3